MADDLATARMIPLTLAASGTSDASLAAKLRAGDFEAFTDLYDLLAAPAYALAYRLMGDDAGQAEDVVQEVLLSLWERPERYDAARGTLRTWVLSAVHHRAVDRIRRRVVHPQTSLDAAYASTVSEGSFGGSLATSAPTSSRLDRLLVTANTDDPAEQVERAERAGAVRLALATLPVHQREALVLIYFGGLTQQQVATHLHEPLGTVKTRVRLALVKLRSLLALYDERCAPPDPPSPRQYQHTQEGGYPRDHG